MPFHGGFGLLNLYGIAKPVYRAFELMKKLGTKHWPVQGKHETVSVWVGENDGASTQALLVNVAMPRHAIATEAVEFKLASYGGRRARAVMMYRIDGAHANPLSAWESMGQPQYLKPSEVKALNTASLVVAETFPFQHDGEGLQINLLLEPQSVALLRIEWA